MARRGEVLVSRRRLGFTSDGTAEHFVVLQADALSDLDTVVVAPLDADTPLYKGDPLVVRISAREAGARQPHVVLVHMLSAAMLERFEVAHVSKLSVASMEKIEERLRTILAVP